MSGSVVGIIVLACTFGGALIGLFLRKALPGHHLDSDSRDTIKVSIGLIATMTALLLGLVFAGAACAVIRLPTFLVSLPLVGLAGAIAVRPPAPKRVRAIGVALVIASVASAALALAIG